MAKAQSESKRTASVTTTSAQVSPPTIGKVRRNKLLLINLSADVVTVGFGNDAVVAGVGAVLLQNQVYIESDNNNDEFTWQGAIQAVSAGTSNLTIVERFTEEA